MSRLSWFPFYVDDFLGGTTMFTSEDTGKYLRCLLAQWSSQEKQAIPADEEGLRILCGGEVPSKRVLAKFEVIDIEGERHLRNKRLSTEWSKAHREHTSKSLAGKHPRQPHTTTTTIDNHKEQQTTNNQKRQRPSPAATSPDGSGARATGWNAEAADDWRNAYDGDPPALYFGAVKALVRKFGWDRVRPVLRFYMAETAIEYVNLSKLRGAFGQWESRMGGGSRASPRAREHEAGLVAFIQGGKRDGRLLGQGDGVAGGQSAAEGREPRRDGPPGRYLPPGTRTSDG